MPRITDELAVVNPEDSLNRAGRRKNRDQRADAARVCRDAQVLDTSFKYIFRRDCIAGVEDFQ